MISDICDSVYLINMILLLECVSRNCVKFAWLLSCAFLISHISVSHSTDTSVFEISPTSSEGSFITPSLSPAVAKILMVQYEEKNSILEIKKNYYLNHLLILKSILIFKCFYKLIISILKNSKLVLENIAFSTLRDKIENF